MAYPESCYTGLVGIRGICEPKEALYWLNDMPGIDLNNLAKIATTDNPTGTLTAESIIDSAARFMIADVEAIYDGKYKVENTIVNGCSICTFTTNYASGSQLGVMIKDNTKSSYSKLVIDRLTVCINDTGTFTVVIDDGVAPRLIPLDFIAGEEVDILGINYRTKKKKVRLYMQETVSLAQLSCPRTSSGCGCGGKKSVVDDLIYTGTLNGNETQQAYGFLPCAFITCDAEDLLCSLAHSAPRMIGMALLFKCAEQFFRVTQLSQRNNRLTLPDKEEKVDEAARYMKLYNDRLNGKGVRGVKDIVFTTLKETQDACVVCNSNLTTAWASG